MGLLEGSSGKNGILTVVFASLFLVLFGMVSHDAFADNVTATIPVSGSYGVAVNSDTNMIYVAQGHGYGIQAIDGATDTVVATIKTSPAPSDSYGCTVYSVAANPQTNLIYTNNGACVHGSAGWIPQTISVVNGTNNKVIAVKKVGGGNYQSQPPMPIALNPTTNKIYAIVFKPAGKSLNVIDGTTNQITASISVPNDGFYHCGCSDIAINQNTNTVYVLDGSLIYVINGTTNSIATSFGWDKSSSQGIGVNPETDRIYVSNSDNSISVIDGTTDQVIENVPSTTYGFVTVNPSTDKIYVSDVTSSNLVAVLDGATDKVVDTVQVGQNPYGIGINANTNKIYVGNSGSATVSVIDGSISSPDFLISSYPFTLTMPAGAKANSTITVSSWYGFSGTISLSSYAPSSLNVGLENSSVTVQPGSSVSSILNISAPSSDSYGQYAVKVEGTNGSLTRSGTAIVTVITAPSAPSIYRTNVVSSSEIDLYWSGSNDNGSPIKGYKIYRSTSSGTETLLTTMGLGDLYDDTGLTNGVTYYYKVTAVNSIGESVPSNEASATPTTPTTIPNPPTGLTATTISPSQINLSWTAASNGGSAITNYNVYRGTSSDSETLLGTIGNVTSYNDTRVANGQQYFYEITAVNSIGQSMLSNEVNATPASGSAGTSGIVLNNVQSTSGTTDPSNQITLSNFNATAGADRLLVVGVSANSNNVGSITFAGVPLAREVSHFTNNDAEFWYLTNPSGTGDIAVTMNGPTQAVVGAYSFSGVNQTTDTSTHHKAQPDTKQSCNIDYNKPCKRLGT